MMKKHGLRRFFSLLLAVFMVCTLLPTAALAEDTTDQQSVGVEGKLDEGKQEPKQKEVQQPEGETPEEPKQDEVKQPEGKTPEEPKQPEGETPEEPKQPEGETSQESAKPVKAPSHAKSTSVPLTLTVTCYGAPFRNGNTGVHDVGQVKYTYHIERSKVGSDNPRNCSATGRFVGNNETGWTLVIDIVVDNYKETMTTNARITNKDMSAATGDITFGLSFNTSGGTGTTIRISGARDLPKLPTFTLNYEANGGTGAPASQTYNATSQNEKSHVFTISPQEPTRENYTFLGWSTDRNATAAEYQPNDKITVTGTTTLYAVWKGNAPAQPTAPSDNDVKALLGENAVEIICTNAQIGHGSMTFGLIDDTFTVYKSNNRRYEVVIKDFTPYVSKFNDAVGVPTGTHFTDNSMASQNRTKINLVWSDGKWTAADAPAKCHVMCNAQPMPDKPAAPGEGDLKNIGKLVRIVCDRNIHEAKEYDVIAGSYEFGDINMTDDVPTCPVTIRAAKYVEAYNGTIGVEHTITGDTEKLLTLAWDANNNVWRPRTDTPVTFTVICPPAKPGAEDLAKLEAPVEVVCTAKPETHAAKRFPLIDETYNIGDVSGNPTDGYTCDITVTADEYVTKYNTEFGKHTPTGDNTKPLTLKYVEGRWVVNDPVVFQVVCVPDAPTEGYLKDLLNREVTVTCTTNAAHAPAEYGLLDDSYRVSGVQPDGNGGYTYTVTIAAAEYVKKYNTERPKNHSLVKDEPAEKSVTLVWNADKRDWRFADANAVPVNFNVECLYTVTYEDGENGSVFKTVSFLNLKKGEATPTIEDPIRVGYEFVGWTPKVAETVTGDVTYTAQWEDVDTTFTVKYNDNVKGKAFTEQVYKDLKYNEETPGFNGTPKRSGYTFTGWKPVVADRVTKDVVYYAQWKSNSGKDRVPKTGDGQIVMILGSVLLFSFCGATAVCLNDRKRKQG